MLAMSPCGRLAVPACRRLRLAEQQRRLAERGATPEIALARAAERAHFAREAPALLRLAAENAHGRGIDAGEPVARALEGAAVELARLRARLAPFLALGQARPALLRHASGEAQQVRLQRSLARGEQLAQQARRLADRAAVGERERREIAQLPVGRKARPRLAADVERGAR